MKSSVSLIAATFTFFTFGLSGQALAIDPGPDDTTEVSEVTTPDDPGNPVGEPPLSVVENEVQTLRIYPNPCVGSEFTMDIPLADSEPIALFVYDMSGRLMERKSGNYGELRHFRFRHLDEANYIIKVFAKEQRFQSRVMVVHR